MTITKNYQHVNPFINQPPKGMRALHRYGAGLVLAPAFWLAAHRFNMPGLALHRKASVLAINALFSRNPNVSVKTLLNTWLYPIDLTRYFEFEFVWQTFTDKSPEHMLDISSPRLLPLLLLNEYQNFRVELLNPDLPDLQNTRQWVNALGMAERVGLHGCLAESAPFAEGTFDLITSISVIEHIPHDADAMRAIWRLLKPGGRLLITLPCAARASEEYVNLNHYNLLNVDERGYVFLEYIYDQNLIEQRFFSILGQPTRMKVYGEKRKGTLRDNLVWRWSGKPYSNWQEPYMMGRDYAYFDAIQQLPGEGVVGLEFVK